MRKYSNRFYNSKRKLLNTVLIIGLLLVISVSSLLILTDSNERSQAAPLPQDLNAGWVVDGQMKDDIALQMDTWYLTEYVMSLSTTDITYELVVTYPDCYDVNAGISMPPAQVGAPVPGTAGGKNTLTYTFSTINNDYIAAAVDISFKLKNNMVFNGMSGDYTAITADFTAEGTTVSKTINAELTLDQGIGANFINLTMGGTKNTFRCDGVQANVVLAVGTSGYPGSLKNITVTVDLNEALIGGQTMADFLVSKGVNLNDIFTVAQADSLPAGMTFDYTGGLMKFTVAEAAGSISLPFKLTVTGNSAIIPSGTPLVFPPGSMHINASHNGYGSLLPAEAGAVIDKDLSADALLTLTPFDLYLAPRAQSWRWYADDSIIIRGEDNQPFARVWLKEFDPSIKDVAIRTDITATALTAQVQVQSLNINAYNLCFVPYDDNGTTGYILYEDSYGNTAQITVSKTAVTSFVLPVPLNAGDYFTLTFESMKTVKIGNPYYSGSSWEGVGGGLGSSDSNSAIFEMLGRVDAPIGQNGAAAKLTSFVWLKDGAGIYAKTPGSVGMYISGYTFNQRNAYSIIINDAYRLNYGLVGDVGTSLDQNANFNGNTKTVQRGDTIYLRGSASIGTTNLDNADIKTFYDPVILFRVPYKYLDLPSDITAKNPDGTYKYVTCEMDNADGTGKVQVIPTNVRIIMDSNGMPYSASIDAFYGNNSPYYLVAVEFKGVELNDIPAMKRTQAVYATLMTTVSSFAPIGTSGNLVKVAWASSDWAHAGQQANFSGEVNWPSSTTSLAPVWRPQACINDNNWHCGGGYFLSSGADIASISLVVTSGTFAEMQVGVDVYNMPYSTATFKTYNPLDPNSQVPEIVVGRDGQFLFRIENQTGSDITDPVGYFILPQSDTWVTYGHGPVVKQAGPDFDVYYTLDAISTLDDTLAGKLRVGNDTLTWTLYTGGDLPSGVTALKFKAALLPDGEIYESTFGFTIPGVNGSTVNYNEMAKGRTIYNLGPFTSDNGRTAAVKIVESTAPEVFPTLPGNMVLEYKIDGFPATWASGRVVDDESPVGIASIVITLNGNPFASYMTANVTHNPPSPFSLNTQFQITAPVTLDTNTKGVYVITYTSTPDAEGFIGTAVRTITVADRTAALLDNIVITLQVHKDIPTGGWNEYFKSLIVPGTSIGSGVNFVDPQDPFDQSKITFTPVTALDIDTIGTYTYTIGYTDPAGNVSLPKTLTINVSGCTVTFNTMGGSPVPPQQIVPEGGKAVKPADPTLAGSTFLRWYLSSDPNTAFDFNTPITASITLYAAWGSDNYTLVLLTTDIELPVNEPYASPAALDHTKSNGAAIYNLLSQATTWRQGFQVSNVTSGLHLSYDLTTLSFDTITPGYDQLLEVTASWNNGNTEKITLGIKVSDKVAPIITIPAGVKEYKVGKDQLPAQESAFFDAIKSKGVTIIDSYEGDIWSKAVFKYYNAADPSTALPGGYGDIDRSQGTYLLVIDVTDGSGNAAVQQSMRIVIGDSPVTPPSTSYTVKYLPGTHGTFSAVTYSGLKLGDPTPAAPTPTGEPGWRFNGWDPTPTPYVTGNATYTALWMQAEGGNISLLIYAEAIDPDGVKVGDGTLFTVKLFDSNKTLIGNYEVPANEDPVTVNGLSGNTTYYLQGSNRDGYVLFEYEIKASGATLAAGSTSAGANITLNVTSDTVMEVTLTYKASPDTANLSGNTNWLWWLLLLLLLLLLILFLILWWIRSGLFVTVTKADEAVEGAAITYRVDKDGDIRSGIKTTNRNGKRRIAAKKDSVVTITMAAKDGNIAKGLPAIVVMEHRREYLSLILK